MFNWPVPGKTIVTKAISGRLMISWVWTPLRQMSFVEKFFSSSELRAVQILKFKINVRTGSVNNCSTSRPDNAVLWVPHKRCPIKPRTLCTIDRWRRQIVCRLFAQAGALLFDGRRCWPPICSTVNYNLFMEILFESNNFRQIIGSPGTCCDCRSSLSLSFWKPSWMLWLSVNHRDDTAHCRHRNL